MSTPVENITGVILAGGRGRRLEGADKGLALWHGKPIIEYVLNALKPQVGHLLINANRNRDRYAEFGCPVIHDELPDFQGPLSGLVSAMDAAVTGYLVITPCDCPDIAGDLVQRLYDAMKQGGHSIGVAHDGKRLQPVFALFDRRLRDSLNDYLRRGGRKPDQWYAEQGFCRADLSDQPHTFSNLNTAEDFARRIGPETTAR